MQRIKQLAKFVGSLAGTAPYLFTQHDLRSVLPDLTQGAFKAVISRAVKQGLLRRVCRGVYLYPSAGAVDGRMLYHTAAKLRAGQFNYISLESALSDAGVISQIPMNWITVMSSGRSQRINCGDFGTIEFVHTKKRPEAIADQLAYDALCHMWRSSTALALRDMKATGRNLDLVDWEAAGVAL